MTRELGRELEALALAVRASTVAVHDEGGRGAGAGVVWAASGLVITNAHVVRGRHATVEGADGRRVHARLAGRDPALDLAALVVARLPDGTRAAEIRDAATLAPGELVVAVGNPHGIAGAFSLGTVHRGGAHRVVHDVRLAPGNSGGPLADASGRVVGINAMIVRGLGVAVPSAVVAAFVRSLRAGARAA